MDIKEMNEPILRRLIEEYDKYIQEANEEEKYADGWKPVCIQEFADCEFEEILLHEAVCLECGKEFKQERDIQLCDNCVDKFDLDTLWKKHDNNELDALDFNENKNMREKFRKWKKK